MAAPTLVRARPAIAVRGVSKTFRLTGTRRELKSALLHPFRAKANRVEPFAALHDVSLEVPRGQSLGVIGHNGSGKSTLLRLIAGITKPSRGRIELDGRVAALLELGAGFHDQ